MLSYQHAYHAGNLADVHKHALLAWVLDYLVQKDKPLTYIETHAGRGLYDLGGAEAARTGEAAAGILRAEATFSPAHPYRRRLAEVRARFGPDAYPGSPLIAALSLREGDRMHLAELHPAEVAALSATMRGWGAQIHHRDGIDTALALTPPTPRRGLLLADPAWEVKADYETIPRALAAVARKWNVGHLMLWYPILTSGAHLAMAGTLDRIPGGFRHEVRFPPARPGHGMVGSGIFTVNPPWGMEEAAAGVAAAITRATAG